MTKGASQRGLGTRGVRTQSLRHEVAAAAMARRRLCLSLGGLAVARNLLLDGRTVLARELERDVSVKLEVEQLQGGLGPDDVPARLTFALSDEESGKPILWKDLETFASMGSRPHAIHIHVYDEDDPDIPGIEVGHLHPEEFGNPAASTDGKYDVEFDFPHSGTYAVEVSYLLTENKGAAPKTIRVPIKLLSKYDV